MITTKEYFISSCDDFELNIKRESKLRFLYTYDDEIKPKAIISVVPGLGGDANSNYRKHLTESIVAQYRGG